MSENERQDPAEPKKLDKAVETSDQPADTQPEPVEVSPAVEHDGGPVQELRTVAEPTD